MNQKYGMECHGIDPSTKAIEYGEGLIRKKELKQGGLCIIIDFDTPVPYIRENIHNKMVPTYKTDYAGHLIPYGYSLIEKKTYSHLSVAFVEEIQERVSTQIFYKENVIDFYVRG